MYSATQRFGVLPAFQMSRWNTKCQINETPRTALSVAHPFVFVCVWRSSFFNRRFESVDGWVSSDSGHRSRYVYRYVSCVSCLGTETWTLWINRWFYLYFCCNWKIVFTKGGWIYVALGFLCNVACYIFYEVAVKASFWKAFWIEYRKVLIFFPLYLMAIGAKNISCFGLYGSYNLWLWCSETET